MFLYLLEILLIKFMELRLTDPWNKEVPEGEIFSALEGLFKEICFKDFNPSSQEEEKERSRIFENFRKALAATFEYFQSQANGSIFASTPPSERPLLFFKVLLINCDKWVGNVAKPDQLRLLTLIQQLLMGSTPIMPQEPSKTLPITISKIQNTDDDLPPPIMPLAIENFLYALITEGLDQWNGDTLPETHILEFVNRAFLTIFLNTLPDQAFQSPQQEQEYQTQLLLLRETLGQAIIDCNKKLDVYGKRKGIGKPCYFAEFFLKAFPAKARLKEPKSEAQRLLSNVKGLMKSGFQIVYWSHLQDKKLKEKLIKTISIEKVKVEGFVKDGMILCGARKAVAHIICGEVFRLDPVIGDAACENRPPFVLDMCEIIIQLVPREKFQLLCQQGRKYIEFWNIQEIQLKEVYEGCKQLGLANEPGMGQPENIFLADQVYIHLHEIQQLDHDENFHFIEFCDLVCKTISSPNFEYLGLCKLMTNTRHMIYDRLGLSLGDMQKNNMPPVMRGEFKARLGQHSTRYLREAARRLKQIAIQGSVPQGLIPQLSDVLDQCSCGLIGDGVIPVQILPIYDAMRFITTYELTKKRPFVFVINRMVVKNKLTAIDNLTLQQEGATPVVELEFISFTPTVILYEADETNGCFKPTLTPIEDLHHKPCTVFECWSVLNVDEKTPDLSNPIMAGLFSQNNDLFIEALMQCDIAHLMQLYAASHPPMSGRGKPYSEVNGKLDKASNNSVGFTEFPTDSGLTYITNLQQNVSGGNIVQLPDLTPYGVTSPISCLSNVNLAQEYRLYRQSSISCNMLFVGQHAPVVVYHNGFRNNQNRTVCSQFEYRYGRNIFFRISHILPSTYAVTVARVKAVLANLVGYQINCLIDETDPSNSIEEAKSNNKDCYYRDDQ